jgi:AmiR/NasT family two-component response regulator
VDNLSISIAASRDLVDWAARLVAVEAGCSFDDAYALMRNTADASDTTIECVADEVVAGRVSFGAT